MCACARSHVLFAYPLHRIPLRESCPIAREERLARKLHLQMLAHTRGAQQRTRTRAPSKTKHVPDLRHRSRGSREQAVARARARSVDSYRNLIGFNPPAVNECARKRARAPATIAVRLPNVYHLFGQLIHRQTPPTNSIEIATHSPHARLINGRIASKIALRAGFDFVSILRARSKYDVLRAKVRPAGVGCGFFLGGLADT